MNGRVTIGRGVVVLGAMALVLATAGVTYMAVRPGANEPTAKATSAPPPSAAVPAPSSAVPAPASDTPLPDLEVNLTAEAVARAGIEVGRVGTSDAADVVRIPAVIEANAYRRVSVTPLVAGRVTRVHAELGDHVKRGATLALVYSPGLTDAQTKYLSATAQRDASAQELKRTERLVAIGAASQQELERTRATHTSVATAVEGARAELVLLGMTPAAIDRLTTPSEVTAATSVPAPIEGAVIERQANPGLNVDPSMTLFTIADLSTVWAIGAVYEQDFPHVQVGNEVTITTTAYPGRVRTGRVTYIDPQLNVESRTARVRVEVANPARELRLGMFAELHVARRGVADAVTVPRDTVQTIGNRHVVYLATPGERGRFVEREVRLGETRGDTVEIASGVSATDTVVTKGSFFLRAERERRGLRAAPTDAPSTAPEGMPGMHMGGGEHASQGPRVVITEQGFQPDRVAVPAGQPVRVTFVRSTDNTCAKEVAVPSQQIKRALPLNEPVVVELPGKAGEVTFVCGMNMLRGTVVVQ